MIGYIVDFTVVAGLIIGITALNGVLLNTLGETFFGGRRRTEIADHSTDIQAGWNQVGGSKK